MNRFSGVGARLGLALLVVLAGALALVYLIVVPSLENRLVNSRVSELRRAAAGLARELPSDRFRWPDFLESASESANARIVVYDHLTPPSALVVVGDSGVKSSSVEQDQIALRAAQAGKPVAGRAEHGGERFAEAAVPIAGGRSVLLVQSPLRDALASVDLVRNRLVLAGLLALAAALAVGYGGAWLFARRLRRLETAAERIAAGQFDEPIRDTGADEVGELARTFDRMRERLAALDHARREFIANASHELRTPIFSLGGFVELLETENPTPAERRAFVAEMRAQIERLQKLTIDLLDLSRLDADVMEIRRERVDLKEVTRQVANEFGPAAKAHGSILQVRGRGQVVALADLNRVSQIIRILIDNALTHTPQGTKVTVTAVRGDEYAELIVGDDAKKGIDPRAIDKVFDRFYTSDTATGSGLGLAIADELALRMNGRLDVVSRRGFTAFTLGLPLAERRERRREPAGAAA